jgi:peptide-methionine (R)-S-oxide reductase
MLKVTPVKTIKLHQSYSYYTTNQFFSMIKSAFLYFLSIFLVTAAFAQGHHFAVAKSDAEWKKQLDAETYQVTRKEGTERAYSGKYWNNHETGIYSCICCGQQLFSSATKFESGTGWPSFWQPLNKSGVLEESDRTIGMERTKVTCSRCGAHLGHVFDDGPKPTGLRYCLNSVSLSFAKKSAK